MLRGRNIAATLAVHRHRLSRARCLSSVSRSASRFVVELGVGSDTFCEDLDRISLTSSMSHCVPHTTRAYIRVECRPKMAGNHTARKTTPSNVNAGQRHTSNNAAATKQPDHDGRTSSNHPLPRVSIGLLPAGCIQ